MSLQTLITQAITELEQARELFGPAPRPESWDSGGALTSVHDSTAAQRQSATVWLGAGAAAYRDAANTAVATLGDAIAADDASAAQMAVAVQSASDGRTAMSGIVSDARAGVAAIAPTTDTPAGRQQLIVHLRHQIERAQAVLKSTIRLNEVIAADIRAASGGYRRTGASQTSPPPRVDGGSGIRLVDYQPPQPKSPPPGDGPPEGPHLIYCYPHSGSDPWLCEGWDYDTERPYTFSAPWDLSGAA